MHYLFQSRIIRGAIIIVLISAAIFYLLYLLKRWMDLELAADKYQKRIVSMNVSTSRQNSMPHIHASNVLEDIVNTIEDSGLAIENFHPGITSQQEGIEAFPLKLVLRGTFQQLNLLLANINKEIIGIKHFSITIDDTGICTFDFELSVFCVKPEADDEALSKQSSYSVKEYQYIGSLQHDNDFLVLLLLPNQATQLVKLHSVLGKEQATLIEISESKLIAVAGNQQFIIEKRNKNKEKHEI